MHYSFYFAVVQSFNCCFTQAALCFNQLTAASLRQNINFCTKMSNADNQEGCITVDWEIQNFLLLLEAGERGNLWSPPWQVKLTEGSASWCWLSVWHKDSDIWFHLSCDDRTVLFVQCEMSLDFSNAEVQLVKSSSKWSFYAKKDAFLGEKRHSMLPNDTATFRCRMWNKTLRSENFRMQSILCSINNQFSVSIFESYYSYISLIKQDGFLLYISLNQEDQSDTGTCVLEVAYAEKFISFVDCALSEKDGNDCVRVMNNNIPPPFVRWTCDVEIQPEKYSGRVNLRLTSIVALQKVCQIKSSRPLCDDLLLLYRKKLFSDATLTTEGRSFAAHKAILAARSPVFHAMFEQRDSTEARSGVVAIDDIDSDTVDRMLGFLYSESLEVVSWDEASALYYAADKYDVPTLKLKCAGILKAGLTADNACDLLVLADMHSDKELLEFVVDFLLGHEEVISSAHWEELEKSNSILAAKIARQLFLKKR